MYITSRLHAHEAFKIYKYRFENICFLCDIIFAYTVPFLTVTMNCNWTSALIKVIKLINILPSIAACLVIKWRKKMKNDLIFDICLTIIIIQIIKSESYVESDITYV